MSVLAGAHQAIDSVIFINIGGIIKNVLKELLFLITVFVQSKAQICIQQSSQNNVNVKFMDSGIRSIDV